MACCRRNHGVRGDEMKCTKCGCQNITKANYCRQCGNAYTEEDRKKAYNQTLYGKLDQLSNLKAIVSLEVITSNKLFRALVIVAILWMGYYISASDNRKLQILESDDYTIEYNTVENEYYLDTDKNSIELSLYVPQEYQELSLRQFDQNDVLLNEQKCSLEDNLVLNNSAQCYYIIEAVYESAQSENLTLYIY